VRPFQTYNGGKNGSGVYQAIINQIPPHLVFISGFAGNCGVLANKRPASMANIAIDLDTSVSEAWKEIPGIISLNQDTTRFIPDLIRSYPADIIPNIYLFLDPPYLKSVRSGSGNYYKKEMLDQDQHEVLLDMVQQLPVMVGLVHYPCDLYDNTLSDWRKVDFTGRTRSGTRTERLYMNYPPPEQLHDYRYIGNDFRERELYRKSRNNIVAKFKRMEPLERNYIIQELKSSGLLS